MILQIRVFKIGRIHILYILGTIRSTNEIHIGSDVGYTFVLVVLRHTAQKNHKYRVTYVSYYYVQVNFLLLKWLRHSCVTIIVHALVIKT